MTEKYLMPAASRHYKKKKIAGAKVVKVNPVYRTESVVPEYLLCCFPLSGQSVQSAFCGWHIFTLICTRLSFFPSINCFLMHCASCRKIFLLQRILGEILWRQ